MSMVADFLEIEEEDLEESEEPTRPVHRTEPLYRSTAPSGESWVEYFKALKTPLSESEDEEPEEKSTLLATGIPLGELTGTQSRIWKEAEKAGFKMEGYESLTHFAEKVQQKDGKIKADGTQVLAGEVTKAAYDARNIFIGGHVPKSALRFHASWLDGTFRGFVWDPIGRYMYANSQAADERETYWVERKVTDFELWLDEYREMLTGDSRRLQKEAAAQRKAEREAAKQTKGEA